MGIFGGMYICTYVTLCLSNSDHMELFTELQGLMAVDNNFESSRSLLQKEGTAKHIEQGGSDEKKKRRAKPHSESVLGVVPHLGTFLQDLTYLDTAFPDTTTGGMINFEKRRKVGSDPV